MTEPSEESGSGTITVKMSKAIYEECKKIAESTGKGIRETIDNIFFTKLAMKKEEDGSISTDDANCSEFELAVKYLKNKDAIKYLTQAATLKYRQAQIALTNARIEKLKNDSKPNTITEYINKFCCPACSEQFSSPAQCMSHFNDKHEQEQETSRVHLCPFCTYERVFSSSGSLSAHILTEHKDRMTIVENHVKPPPSPIERPMPNVPPVIQEVKVYGCYCGQNFNTDMERAQHAVKCSWLQRYAEAQARRVTA